MDLGLDSLVGDKGAISQLTALGDSLNAGVTKALGWGSLVGISAPPAVKAPLPAPNGILPNKPTMTSAITQALTSTAGMLVIGVLAIGFLLVLVVRGR